MRSAGNSITCTCVTTSAFRRTLVIQGRRNGFLHVRFAAREPPFR